ncbi:hypothetical protein EMIHUDRAFT_252292 [Emiliania huxleyi CCMP1516]|uniref:TRAF3-interacting protein 1 n=2 Tax=Emiliania huxleyi TaxID=2903 RepID=A0A0D3KMI4_EMIH1|nr:hypothetical protein EMIHUDRAFT_252292 [Emiliania huxleyi CCMP1516]EOD36969.1 hypothetical protein EMIHUDRAFT_252292 [Emiliania huxleyi CCMP1516]|eukprot:XP_005789398.1 hypothetical protein EMIHUDRAFT_252292 [Emiliania huxleyi CCMP1516]
MADPEWVTATQTALGPLIKRPKLTAALLSKPPFRFLHDIVSEVTRATGFADGLFSEDELQSGRIKEKELKIAYLSKIFKCVEVASGGALGVRPGKVVAGMEPENTNAFLVALARVATSGVDNAGVVASTLDAIAASAKSSRSSPPASAPPGAEASGAEQEASCLQRPRRSHSRWPPRHRRNGSIRRAAEKTSGGKAVPAVEIVRDGADEEDDDTVLMVDPLGEQVDTTSMDTAAIDAHAHGKLVRNLLEAQLDMEGARRARLARAQSGSYFTKRASSASFHGGAMCVHARGCWAPLLLS